MWDMGVRITPDVHRYAGDIYSEDFFNELLRNIGALLVASIWSVMLC